MVAPRPRGSSLIEVGLVFTLLAGLLTLVAIFFVRGQRYATDTETYATVQRNSAMVLRKVTSDLAASTLQLMESSPSEDAVWFLSSRPAAPTDPYMEFNPTTGKIMWRKWVCYYHDAATQSVIRAEMPLDEPESEFLVAPARGVSLGFFQTSPDVVRQPVGQRVSFFRTVRTGNTVQVSLITQAEAPLTNSTAQDRLVEVRISSDVTLVN